MENSNYFGGIEECCNSSESGWTTYLASPMHGDGGYSKESNISHGGNEGHHDEGEDDDSMASDASSGPARRIKYDDGESCSHCSYKQTYKVEKKRDEKTNLVRKGHKGNLQKSSKVKKTNFKGK